MKSVSIVQFCFTGACLFFLPVAEKKVSSSIIFTRLMNTLCLWLFLTVCESLSRCLDSVSCFLFRQVPPHVSRLSFLSLSLVDCPDDVTCPWSASCLFVPRVSSASSSQLLSLYLVCFSFCVFCVSPGSYFFFSTCWFFDQLFIIFCLLFHHFRSLVSAAGSGSATITPPLCVFNNTSAHSHSNSLPPSFLQASSLCISGSMSQTDPAFLPELLRVLSW